MKDVFLNIKPHSCVDIFKDCGFNTNGICYCQYDHELTYNNKFENYYSNWNQKIPTPICVETRYDCTMYKQKGL